MISCGLLFYSCGEGEKVADLESKVEQLTSENTTLQKDLTALKEKVGEGQVYKLGCSLAITGPTSDAGNPYSKGVEDYVQYVNDEKLLGDSKLVCFIKDDGYENEATKRNFEEFLDEGIVLYLNYSTGSTLALKNDFEEEKIPVIPASFHAGNLEGSHYIFLPIVSYSNQAISLSEYIVANHKKGTPQAAMFINPSAFGRGPVDDLKKAVAAGLKMDILEVVEHGQDLDNTALLKRLLEKKVQYVICHTVQPPVATLLKSAQALGVAAKTYGEPGKLTFLGLHYAGGPDLITLAGSAAEGYYWTTSYKLTSYKDEGADAQLALAKRYGRDEKTANSQNYTNGVQVAQIAVEAIRRAKAKGNEIDRQSLYEELLAMNGYDAYYPLTTVGPVTFSKDDQQGVDTLQLYRVEDGVFQAIGVPFRSEFVKKVK
ncbi:MAG: ABC transporter substrate-binding protein [Deltaproteobacteria bacterium]|nr:ABC transporter substrate-binding protein [Deltaproteobacteria bacterium]